MWEKKESTNEKCNIERTADGMWIYVDRPTDWPTKPEYLSVNEWKWAQQHWIKEIKTSEYNMNANQQ